MPRLTTHLILAQLVLGTLVSTIPTAKAQSVTLQDMEAFASRHYPIKSYLPDSVAGVPFGLSFQDAFAYCPSKVAKTITWVESEQEALCYSQPVYVPYTRQTSKLPVLTLKFSLAKVTAITLFVPNRASVERLTDLLTKKYGAPDYQSCDANNTCSAVDWKKLALMKLFRQNSGAVLPDQQWWDTQTSLQRKTQAKAPFWAGGKGGYYWELVDGSIILSSSDGKLYVLRYQMAQPDSY